MLEIVERSKKRLTLKSGHSKIFIEGYNSFMEGEPIGYNIHNGRDYDIWLDGYMKAYDELKDKNYESK